MKARVAVTLKTGILDPQGKAIESALVSLGIEGVRSVRQGKIFDVELETDDSREAEAVLRQAGERLLANTVIESFRIEIPEGQLASRPAEAPAAEAEGPIEAPEMPPEGHP